ncbi:hypothetical protein F4780DRAFT_20862 [Xylariomycetidae sp. FL0641]|nr:hypothetical protein F4780DRAFT_20862 [Xylariomycetidae sp. FL0641]
MADASAVDFSELGCADVSTRQAGEYAIQVQARCERRRRRGISLRASPPCSELYRDACRILGVRASSQEGVQVLCNNMWWYWGGASCGIVGKMPEMDCARRRRPVDLLSFFGVAFTAAGADATADLRSLIGQCQFLLLIDSNPLRLYPKIPHSRHGSTGPSDHSRSGHLHHQRTAKARAASETTLTRLTHGSQKTLGDIETVTPASHTES